MDTTIFDAFPNAILRNEWEYGLRAHNSALGAVFEPIGYVDVILDAGVASELNTSVQTIASDRLIYCRESFPEKDINTIVASGMFRVNVNGKDRYYNVIDAGIGKNQESGKIEHYEFLVRETKL